MTKHGLLERFWEIVVAFGAAIVVESYFNNLRKERVTAVKKKLTDEGRAELMTFLIVELAIHDKLASERILRRLMKYNTKSGGDNKIVTLLGKLYIALGDTPQEKVVRLESFSILGNMEDEQFYSALEGLNNDFIMRAIKRLPEITEEVIKEFMDVLEQLGVFKAMRKADAAVGAKMKEINDGMEKHWYVRLAGKKSLARSIALAALLLVPFILLFTL